MKIKVMVTIEDNKSKKEEGKEEGRRRGGGAGEAIKSKELMVVATLPEKKE